MGSISELPKGDSPTLALVHPTRDELIMQWKLNGAEWRGALSLPAYLRREEVLSSQALTRDGGISYWIIIDTALEGNPLDPASNTRLPLASCETYRKKALVWQDGKVQEVICHGIGAVFCASHLRKRGYAQRLMTELAKVLRTYQTSEGKDCLFSVLYSDIGKVSWTGRTPCPLLTLIEILQHFWLGAIQFITYCHPRLPFSKCEGSSRSASIVCTRPS